jgi:integrase
MRRQGNKLTALEVKKDLKQGLYGDGHGLYLQVSSFDTKAWVFRFTIDGRPRKMGLGPLHTVSLAEARRRAAEARLKAHDGIDPIEDKQAQRAHKRLSAAKAMTFKQAADAYVEANRAAWKNPKHAKQWASTFNETKRGKRAHPATTAEINDLVVSAIDTGLVLKVLEPIWTVKPETAVRVRGRIEAVLDWAKVRGFRDGENPARWRGHLDHILPKKSRIASVEHLDALPYHSISAFMAELRAKEGVTARALEFAILTATRSGEILGAQWSEIDADSKLWTIPAKRMKGKKEHRVPLSDRAVEILEPLPRDGERVFAAVGRDGMLECLRQLRAQGTVHGFRSTFRDWAAETTAYPNELLEIALAHTIGSKAEAAYRRGDMMEKRRRLMADWAAYCVQPPANSRENVVSIGAAR